MNSPEPGDAKPQPQPANVVADRWLQKRTLIVVATGAGLLAALWALWSVAQILLLVFAAVLLAVFLRALASLVESRTPLSMGVCLALVILLLLMGMTVIGVVYGPVIADGFYQLSRQLPQALERIRSGLGHYAWGPPLLDAAARAGGTLADPEQLAKIAGIFSTALGAIGGVFVVVVLGIYLASDPKTYREAVAQLFPPDRRQGVAEAFDHMGHALRWWLLGQIAAMATVGVLTGIGLAVLGIPFAVVLAVVAAVLDFMPNIGPLIAAVPAIMVGVSTDGATALYVALLYFVIQSLEGYLITPIIQERVLSLPPALLLTAQLVMGSGFGILGLLLAPPLAVVGMVLVQMLYVRDRLGEKVDLP